MDANNRTRRQNKENKVDESKQRLGHFRLDVGEHSAGVRDAAKLEVEVLSRLKFVPRHVETIGKLDQKKVVRHYTGISPSFASIGAEEIMPEYEIVMKTERLVEADTFKIILSDCEVRRVRYVVYCPNRDMYLCEVRGALFATWVSEGDREHCLRMTRLQAEEARKVTRSAGTTGVDQEILAVTW